MSPDKGALSVGASSVALVGGDLSGGGGVNRVIRDLSAMLSEDLGLDVTVFSARSAAEPTYPFSHEVKLAFHPEGTSALGYLRVMWKIRRQRFDYVLGFWPQDNIALAGVFLFSRSRLVLSEHVSWHFPGRLVRLLRRVFYRFAWRVLVLNKRDLAHFRGWLGSVRLLSNMVPEMPVAGVVAREKLIIAVGHLDARKGFEDAIRAMALSGLEAEGWSLAIIGNGGERERLRSLIGELGLARTEVHAATSDIASWYARASIQLVTSQVEVFSLVLAEGMQAGVVPIAYATDGPSFILEEEPDLLVPIGQVQAMAKRLQLLASEDLAARRGALSTSIARRFSRERIAAAWRELLT